jgi:hypothetical protein
MQLSHTPVPRAATPLVRPQAGRAPAASIWPFYVQSPRPCFDVELNARCVLETSARYFSAPLAPEPGTGAHPTRAQREKR